MLIMRVSPPAGSLPAQRSRAEWRREPGMGGRVRFAKAGVVVGLVVAGLLPPSVAVASGPALVVEPSEDLLDQGDALATGTGFSAETPITLAMCEAGGGDFDGPCRAIWAYDLFSDAGGAFEIDVIVQRRIQVPGDAPVDCAAESCAVVATGGGDGDRAVAPVTFDASVPLPDPPDLAVEPHDDLADGQIVDVEASGLRPSSHVALRQCTNHAERGLICDRRAPMTSPTDVNGSLHTTIRVHRTLAAEWPETSAMSGGEASPAAAEGWPVYVDCAAAPGVCFAKVYEFEEPLQTAEVPLAFDPEAPPVPTPTVEVDPTVDLVDRQPVNVVGDGFLPGDLVEVKECAASADPLYPPNPCMTLRMATAGEGGVFDLPAQVRRRIATGGDAVDCLDHPGGCVLRVGSLDGSFPWTDFAITFDPDAPLAGAPVVHVDPAAGLVDGQTVGVHGSGFTPFAPVVLLQCDNSGAGPGGCALFSPEFGTADENGDVDDTFVVHGVIAIGGQAVDCAAAPGACAIAVANRDDLDEGGRAAISFGDPPVVAAGLAGIWEGGRRDRTVLRIPVFLSAPSAERVTVVVRTAGLSARPRRDFVPMRETVVFEPGEVRKHVSVEILGDRRPEPLEVLLVKLRDAQGAEIGGYRGLGFGVVWDDDLHRHDRG